MALQPFAWRHADSSDMTDRQTDGQTVSGSATSFIRCYSCGRSSDRHRMRTKSVTVREQHVRVSANQVLRTPKDGVENGQQEGDF
jgi:hypothetical protein